MQLPMCTSGASHSTGAQQSSPPRNLGPVAGNLQTQYSALKSVGYLDEYVRFMEMGTNNKNKVKYQVCGELGNGENNVAITQTLQGAVHSGGSGQIESFKVDIAGMNSAADFGIGHVAKSTCAASQDSAMKYLCDSLTLHSPGIVQNSPVVGDNVDSDIVVETKYHVMKTDKIEHEESECGKTEKERIESRGNESGRIKNENYESEMMNSEKNEMETVSVFVTNTTPVMTAPTFVSGAGCKELTGMIKMTGLACASDSSKMESHKKVMSALGSLLELKKQQGVGTSAGVQDASSHSLQETMAALQKHTEVSVTPICGLKTPKLGQDMKLDTGQTSTQLTDSKVPGSPVLPTVSKDSTNSGHTCSIFKVDVPKKPSGMEKLKAEPKPQTEFRIQINRNNEMYLCNTETGEIKPLHTVKHVKRSSQSSSRSTSVLDEPTNVPVDSKRLSLGLPLHPVQVAESQQNRVSDTVNVVRKLERSKQVTKIAHSNVPVSGMSATPSHVLKSSPSQMTSRPVSSVSNLSQSEVVMKQSQVSKASALSTTPHVAKMGRQRKLTGTVSLLRKEQSAATLTSDQKRNQRKSNIHKGRGKNSCQTTELQEALESCVESMLATDKEENAVPLFRPGKRLYAKVKADRSLSAGNIQPSDVVSTKDIPKTSPSDKQWPTFEREVTVETTTDATPPLLEASPPLLELASSHQLTLSSEEGSSHPPQLTPESNASIRTASTTHISAKNRRCKYCSLIQMCVCVCVCVDVYGNGVPNLPEYKTTNLR